MLIFALKSAIVLSLLYLPYLLMLRRESFFRFNRAVLCGILLCSLTLPLCNLPVLSLDENPVVGAAQQQMIEVGIPIAQGIVPGETASAADLPRTSWWGLVATLYIIVAIMLLALRLHDYMRLRRIIAADCVWQRKAEGGITIYCHRGDMPAFSWYKSIVLSASDYEQNGPCIIRHETGHILCGHSWDVLLLTLVQLVQWFNPLVWVLGQSLQDVHEYEADDYVLSGGVSLDDYRRLLIQKAVGTSPYVFANSFNHSLLKKRITMMCRRKSSPWHRMKALYVLPVAVVALCFFATPEFAKADDIIVRAIEQKVCYFLDGELVDEAEFNALKPEMVHDVTVVKDIDRLASIVPQGEGYTAAVILNTVALTDVDVPSSFPGGEAEMKKWIGQHMRYPAEALEWGQTGKIYVKFIVEKDGRLSFIQTYDGEENLMTDNPEATLVQLYGTTAESLPEDRQAEWKEKQKEYTAARQSLKDEAERVVKEMPRWTPAQKDGLPVRMSMAIPLTFRLN